MSTVDYLEIIEEYIPPGLRAYQIEEGRVDITDYLDDLQNQIYDASLENETDIPNVIANMKANLVQKRSQNNTNTEYLSTLAIIAELVIDRLEQHY
jgi:hypothetical protein